MKKALAAFAVALGGVVSFAGGLMAAKAGAGLLAAGLKVVGVTAVGLLASFGPVLAIFAVLATVVAGFAVAFKGDIGGKWSAPSETAPSRLAGQETWGDTENGAMEGANARRRATQANG